MHTESERYLQTSDFGLHTSKFRLQISESLLSGGEANIQTFLGRTSHFEVQASDFGIVIFRRGG
jgi:hypothetical protein